MIALLIAACAQPAPTAAQAAAQAAQPSLERVGPSEAKALIATLQLAQRDVAAGKAETFEILAGAPALYPAVRVSPLTQFLHMSFDQPRTIERKGMGLWQVYELTYFPPGPHSLMWKVTVTTGMTGELRRIQLLYTAPPPF